MIKYLAKATRMIKMPFNKSELYDKNYENFAQGNKNRKV